MNRSIGNRLEFVQIAVIICCAFFYFLVFAQFAFLHALESMPDQSGTIEVVMMAMGAAGIVSSVYTAKRFRISKFRNWLIGGFVGCGLSAIGSMWIGGLFSAIVVGVAIGVFLGGLTVSIVPVLRCFVPGGMVAQCAALAVGGAYFLSNVPWVFNAEPEEQCLLAALACCIGVAMALVLPSGEQSYLEEEYREDRTHECLFLNAGVWTVAILFLALIWLDSAAFYVIQETEGLKKATWGGDGQLWANAIVHLLGALFAGWAMSRGRLFACLLVAFSILEVGAILLESGVASPVVATWLYVVGVSLYSSGLVAYGALAPEKEGLWSVSTRSGLVFALGGWFGSGMGIGMARDLHAIPIGFLALALLVALGSVASRWRLGIGFGREVWH